MGASLAESTVALNERSSGLPVKGYPPIASRLSAVKDGWSAAESVVRLGYSPGDDLPRFDLPPPLASAVVPVPSRDWMQPGRRLSEAARRLSQIARESGGYQNLRYWAVPDGFAAATAIERINDDGSSVQNDRWDLTVIPPRIFSLSSYLNALFSATRGRYRMIVFVVSPHPFGQRPIPLKFQPSIDWLWTGLSDLPPSVGGATVTESFQCTALVYEFEQRDTYAEALLKSPSAIDGRKHLEMAKLWQALDR